MPHPIILMACPPSSPPVTWRYTPIKEALSRNKAFACFIMHPVRQPTFIKIVWKSLDLSDKKRNYFGPDAQTVMQGQWTV